MSNSDCHFDCHTYQALAVHTTVYDLKMDGQLVRWAVLAEDSLYKLAVKQHFVVVVVVDSITEYVLIKSFKQSLSLTHFLSDVGV